MHVVHLIDSVVAAGAERSLAALVPQLLARGVRVDVAYLRDRPGLQRELLAAGAGLFCLDGGVGRPRWMWRARRLLAERRPDLIHTTLFEAHIAGRIAGLLTGIPVVSTLTGVNYGLDHRTAPSLVPWKVRAAQLTDASTARLVTRFHAVATHVAEVMSRRLLIPRARIEVIPRGRDPLELGTRDSVRRRRARIGLGLNSSDSLVLAVARHDYKKGLDVLLEAFRGVLPRDPRARLALAGPEGNQTAALRSAAKAMGLDGAVRFMGSRDDVPDLLCAADVFVLPSRSEGFPGVLIEAMALEAPVVASDIPGVREAVGNRGGALLVPPGDARALADALIQTISDPGQAAGRAARGRATFLSSYTVDRVADRMIKLYERVLAG